MCEPKKKRLFGKQSQTQEFPRGHPRLLETSAARRSRRQGSSRCLGRGSHLFSPWISLNESHLFLSLLLFLLHLFLFCSAGCFPLVKSGALFLLPKRMKLFRARTHRRRTGVGQGKGGGGRKGAPGPNAGGREGGRERAGARAAARSAAGGRPRPAASRARTAALLASHPGPPLPPSPPRRVTRRPRGPPPTCESPLCCRACSRLGPRRRRGEQPFRKGPGDLDRAAVGVARAGRRPGFPSKGAVGAGEGGEGRSLCTPCPLNL